MKKNGHTMTLDMVLEYAKVFDAEDQPGDLDRGKADSDKKWLRELSKNPEAKVNAYFTSEEQIDFLKGYDGFDEIVKNPQTGEETSRIKEGNEEFGIGKYIVLKRKLNDIREYRNKQGEIKEMDKGGAPSVKILEADAFVDYDYSEYGPVGNGTESKVRFEPKYMRLEALGITDLVEFSDEPYDEDDF